MKIRHQHRGLGNLISLAIVAASALVVGGISLPASANTISKNVGATTPNLSDFHPSAVAYPKKAGYRNTAEHHLFLETFAARCGAGQHAQNGNFSITLQKTNSITLDGGPALLSFWDRGRPHFMTEIWPSNAAAGTVRKLSYRLDALPPVGGLVRTNDQTGRRLLSDGDFSFVVRGNASVIDARLHFNCGVSPNSATGHSHSVAPAAPSLLAPSAPLIDPNSFRLSWGNAREPVPCPEVNRRFPRAYTRHDALIARMQPTLDAQCLKRGHGSQFTFVTLSTCSEGHGEVGNRAGNRVFAEVVCR